MTDQPPRIVPGEPPKLSPDATFSVPEFWMGVARTDDELQSGHAGAARGIADDLRAGKPLRQIAAFLVWEKRRSR